MKGKITIVLLGLALVFGMIAASCDNGAYPAVDNKDELTLFTYDGTISNDAPNLPLTLIKEGDVYKLLKIQRANPDTTKNDFLPQFLLTTTAGLKTGDTADAEKAKKLYPGSRIIVNNPVFVTASQAVRLPSPIPDPDPENDPYSTPPQEPIYPPK